MKTKEEQRKAILETLEQFMLDQAEEEVYAKSYVDQFGNDPTWPNQPAVERNRKTVRFGNYTPVYFLRERIKDDMGYEPIRDDGKDVSLKQRRGGYRTYHYSWLVWSDEHEANVSTIIQRLNDQGFIKLSKSGKAFHVVKKHFKQPTFRKPGTNEIVTYDEIMNKKGD